jgi:hypothetical protein
MPTLEAASDAKAAAVAMLLVQGGDERLALDRALGVNRYGCGPFPDGRIAAFGSATCSTLSGSAQAELLQVMEDLKSNARPDAVYEAGMQQVRDDLAGLLDLPAGTGMVLAASGTDLHLIGADLARGASRGPLLCVTPGAAETGRGVPSALQRAGAAAMVQVPLRTAHGALRPVAEIDRDFEAACARASRCGGKVLIVLADVSKTGVVAPSLGCAAALKARWPDVVEVLVDACQFRISARTLAGYLRRGFLVAATGSKFLTGPPFSGALFVPASAMERLGREAPPSIGLCDDSLRQEWPRAWRGRALLPSGSNFGLLLRWRAALHELRAFRAAPEAETAAFFSAFAAAATRALADAPSLQGLPTAPLVRDDPFGWDAVPTILPFVPKAHSAAETAAVFRALTTGAAGRPIQLGQPVEVRPGVAALRLCASARLAAQAHAAGDGGKGVIADALACIEAVDQAFRPGHAPAQPLPA